MFRLLGGYMGFTPDQIRAMSYAEYLLLTEGFADLKRKESGAKEDDSGPPTPDEARELFDELDRINESNGHPT